MDIPLRDKAAQSRTLMRFFLIITVIFGGIVYAHNREVVRETNLNSVFQEINREHFGGELSGVQVEWNSLDQEYGETRESPTGLLIVVDRNENTSIAELRKTLQHEACHVFVDFQEPEEHGPMFQACMKRFE
jgi:hypothetical protein